MSLPFRPPLLQADWDVAELADWVELATIADGQFLRGTLQSSLARLVGGGANPAAVAGEAWEEVRRRCELYTDVGATRLSGDSLRRRAGHPNTAWHFFLTTLSLGADVTANARRLFEYGVTDVSRALTGRPAMRLGAPRGGELPRPLDDAVVVYTRLSKEEKSHIPFPTTDQDLGLDIATWRGFRDKRGAYLPFLGQCATGKDWYQEHKIYDLQLSLWRRHVLWAVDPVRFFALPFVVPPQHWIRAANGAGLVLDRPRLLELALTAPLARPRRQAVHQYCFGLAAAYAA